MKIILLVLLIGITSNYAQQIELCTTPDKKVGICMNVRQCDSMVKFLLNKNDFTLTERQFLNKYQCGYVNNSPNICCPNNNNIVTSLDGNPKIETQSTASVQDHRNRQLLPTKCGLSSTLTSDRIVMGNKTSINEYPWMALLSYQSNAGLSFKCGGTVINNRYILTAAHCLVDGLLGVRVGEHTIGNATDCQLSESNEKICAQPVQDFFIDEIIVHPNYNQPHKAANDIGLIRLPSLINFSESVTAICLPLEEELSQAIFTGAIFTVTGWGATEFRQSSDELLQTDITVVSPESCQEKYSKLQYTISENQICALNKNGSDSCNGDSGGPTQMLDLTRYVQTGIVSIGPTPCANKEIPGVYTRLDKYLNWILDNITE